MLVEEFNVAVQMIFPWATTTLCVLENVGDYQWSQESFMVP